MEVSPIRNASEKKHWWITNRKMVDKYIKDARCLIAKKDQNDVASAVHLLDAALSLSPRHETAIELKASSLLFLRRFKDVADMLQDYIPSFKAANSEEACINRTSENLSEGLSGEGVKLLSESPGRDSSSFKCFSVSDLKKKMMAGMCKNVGDEGHWRFRVLGQACYRMGLMDDAMVLLQNAKRIATAAFRRESVCWSDDSFASLSHIASPQPRASASSESDVSNHLLCHIKFLLRRRAAALAAMDAGLYAESIRHFSKIVDGRRSVPQRFLAECYMHRASAYRSAGRIADAIADCNKALALDSSCIQALETRSALLESIRCIPDSLHDLEHLKLLYNTILRDRKLPGPKWKRHNVRYREIPGKLCVLTTRIQKLKEKIANREPGNVDYYALIGVRRGCTRSELHRAHLLLSLRHKPDKATCFIERCEFADQNDAASIKDRLKMSSLLLHRLIQKGNSIVTADIAEEGAADKERKRTAAVAFPTGKVEIQAKAAEKTARTNRAIAESMEIFGSNKIYCSSENNSSNSNLIQGVFCRDIAAVGNLLTRAGFSHPITVKYEALTCR